MITYNKLVRDKIPEILDSLGKKYSTHTLPDNKFQGSLTDKLYEEYLEFKLAPSIEELADILEVVYALGDCLGVSKEKLESVRSDKVKKNGAFDKRIFLVEADK